LTWLSGEVKCARTSGNNLCAPNGGATAQINGARTAHLLISGQS
jgi:hypothetical protein